VTAFLRSAERRPWVRVLGPNPISLGVDWLLNYAGGGSCRSARLPSTNLIPKSKEDS